MSGTSWARLTRWLLPTIVLLYLGLGMLYAVYTPPWQAPDEPAHYNYVQYVAEQHRFPILKPGDYPAAYLEEIKAARFPPDMSIASIRYEFHQPPLYYLLAVPIYRLFGGALLPLRLLSVVMGAVLLLMIYWSVRVLVADRPFLALGTTAFVAFLPMHIAFTAAVNNDTLAELLLATVLLLTLRYLQYPASPQRNRRPGILPGQEAGSECNPTGPEGEGTRLLVLLGVTTGLGLVTKSSVYVALPLVVLAIVVRHLWLDKTPPSVTDGLKSSAFYLLPATGLALPWWLRNIALYGGVDFLGLGRHNQVVVGQLRTAEFIATDGVVQLVRDFLLTSFRSFWGQFGWMGVLLDQRLYQALAILSALALIGFLLWATRAWRAVALPSFLTGKGGKEAGSWSGRRAVSTPTPSLPLAGGGGEWQWAACGLLALSGLLTLASYVWYNAQFVQHQGRYLFPALVPISLVVALGWREALRRERAIPLAILSLLAAAALELVGLRSTWLLLLLATTAAALALRRFLPLQWDPVVQAVPYLLLIPLDLISLFLFIIPQLTV